MRPTALPLLPLIAGFLGACGPVPEPQAPEAETPTREEVYEVTRLGKPASFASIAAAVAYQRKVCAPREGFLPEGEHKRRRSCFGPGPYEEIRLLERLLDTVSKDSPDRPKILERMVGNWMEIRPRLVTECIQLNDLTELRSQGDVERRVERLGALEQLYIKAEKEPERLCQILRTDHPSYVPKNVCLPASGPVEDPAPDFTMDEEPEGSWF